jgi:hypothetical protein
MHLTLFLGAGFSAPFGHPVMDDFLSFADSNKRLTDDDRSFLGRLVLEARRANSFLESSPTNLEDILTFSEMGDRLGLTQDNENRGERFRRILQKIFTSTLLIKDYWSRYSALHSLLGCKPSEFKGYLSFVTTNYDLNIESACVFLNAHTNPGFIPLHQNSDSVQSSQYLYATNGIPLFKLHGSVNWYLCDQEPGIKIENRIVKVMGDSDENQIRSLPYPCTANYEPPSVPIIVPPSFLKPDLSKTMGMIWRGAAQTLSKANVVAFIGYSFPPSDTEMMYFLAKAFSENAGLRKIYIIDPSAEKLVERLRSASSKIGSHFRNLLKPIPMDWTEARLSFGEHI